MFGFGCVTINGPTLKTKLLAFQITLVALPQKKHSVSWTYFSRPT